MHHFRFSFAISSTPLKESGNSRGSFKSEDIHFKLKHFIQIMVCNWMHDETGKLTFTGWLVYRQVT